jgi:hypothetical protein
MRAESSLGNALGAALCALPHKRDGDMDREKVKRLLWGGTPRVIEHKEMSRGQQTAWIIAAMALVGFLCINYLESHDDADPYAKCKSVFAADNCRSEVAIERLRRL